MWSNEVRSGEVRSGGRARSSHTKPAGPNKLFFVAPSPVVIGMMLDVTTKLMKKMTDAEWNLQHDITQSHFPPIQ